MQLKQYEIVQNQDLLTVDIQETCMKYKTIKKFAYILHDKDDTRPHYHIYVNFGNNGVSHELVASWFNVPPNFVNKIKGRSTDMLAYLTHSNDSQRHKHQYDPSEVVANFDFETEIANARILGDFKNYSYAQQLEYVNSLPVSEKKAAFSTLERLWKLQCQWLTLHADRHIEVVFIQGNGGTGKTYYAKKFLTSRGLDFCVSSSSNDPFQDYLGQKAIILDDARDEHFNFADFLKILDNETGSTVKSRFTNKIFNGEMIVITSPVPLEWWYKELRWRKDDSLTQLYRRISCYVVVTRDYVNVYEEGVNLQNGRPQGLPRVFKNEVPNLVRKKEKKTDFGEAFGKILEDAVPDLIEEIIKKRPGG